MKNFIKFLIPFRISNINNEKLTTLILGFGLITYAIASFVLFGYEKLVKMHFLTIQIIKFMYMYFIAIMAALCQFEDYIDFIDRKKVGLFGFHYYENECIIFSWTVTIFIFSFVEIILLIK